jgi:hypothetical protein
MNKILKNTRIALLENTEFMTSAIRIADKIRTGSRYSHIRGSLKREIKINCCKTKSAIIPIYFFETLFF